MTPAEKRESYRFEKTKQHEEKRQENKSERVKVKDVTPEQISESTGPRRPRVREEENR